MKLKSMRPEKVRLDKADADLLEQKAPEKGAGIAKQVNVLKTAPVGKEADADGGSGSTSGIFTPSDEQLEAINRLTRSPKSAEEVVCFTTLSCNDLEDRDDDQFTKECVDDFAKLPEPYSSVGKSYMVSHEHKSMPVGRIFEVGTTDVEGGHFLTNGVFMPNTDQYKNFIENLDFGIYWAVSVGVMLGASDCKVCGDPFQWHGYWCANGHEKGMYYDPNSDEEDAYGWPMPVEAGSKGAVKCIQRMFNPKDFYELSQVYLGAQYYAALQKDATFGGIIKAASAGGVPIIGLSRSEAEKLPIPHAPEKVAEARQKYTVSEEQDGTLSWVDDQSLVYNYDPNTSEVTCLGKSNEEASDGIEGRRSAGGPEPVGAPDGGEAVGGEPDPEAGVGSLGGDPEAGGEVDRSVGGPSGSPVADPAAAKENEEDEPMSKATVLAAATKVGVGTSILEKLGEAEGDGLEVVLRELHDHTQALSKEVEELRSKAELGDAYIQSLKGDTIAWFVKAHQDGDTTKGVNTDTVERLLTACGDNVDLIKALNQQYLDLARAKFPEATRRSAAPSESEGRLTDSTEPTTVNTAGVSKIHG